MYRYFIYANKNIYLNEHTHITHLQRKVINVFQVQEICQLLYESNQSTVEESYTYNENSWFDKNNRALKSRDTVPLSKTSPYIFLFYALQFWKYRY